MAVVIPFKPSEHFFYVPYSQLETSETSKFWEIKEKQTLQDWLHFYTIISFKWENKKNLNKFPESKQLRQKIQYSFGKWFNYSKIIFQYISASSLAW